MDKSDTDEDILPSPDPGGVLFTRFADSALFLVKNDIGRDFLKFSLSLFFSLAWLVTVLPILETSNDWWYSLQYALF